MAETVPGTVQETTTGAEAGTKSGTATGSQAATATPIRTHAICRYCAVSCGVFMEIEDGRVMGRGWVQAVEVEPPTGTTLEPGCVVVCPDGQLYELVLRLLPGAEVVSDPDPTEELVSLQLMDSEYVRWAQAAMQALSAQVRPC